MHSHNAMTTHASLPDVFCWTRFGTESGEAIEDIVARKERERSANRGVFLWGIGNSVGPAVRELVRSTGSPCVAFSPMRSKPKAIDVTPPSLMAWTGATALNGDEWEIPEGSRVVSRGSGEGQRAKTSHYALVCQSSEPLALDFSAGELPYEALVNLLSGTKLGHSQVTAVVRRTSLALASPTTYPIALVAKLVFPFFVRLHSPVPSAKVAARSAGRKPTQASLLAMA